MIRYEDKGFGALQWEGMCLSRIASPPFCSGSETKYGRYLCADHEIYIHT